MKVYKIFILLLGTVTRKRMLYSFGGFKKLEVFQLKKLVQLEEYNTGGSSTQPERLGE